MTSVATTRERARPGGARRQTGLGTYVSSATPPPDLGFCGRWERRRVGRASRNSLKALQRRVTESKSKRLCFYALASMVSVDVGRQLVAHVQGVGRCGSPWACPLCAPVIRERRAGEIDQGLRFLLDDGGSAVFVTWTLPHYLGASLASRLEVIADALHRSLKGSAWERRKATLGYLGAIRSVDITHSAANGWHPHLHAVLCFDRVVTQSEVADLRSWLASRWEKVSVDAGFGHLHPVHGVDVRRVETAGDLAGYLTKVDGGWGAGLELARADVKSGRGKGSRSAWQILNDLAETGDAGDLALWLEYEKATEGRNSVRWSPGLRARLQVGPERSDVEEAASEGCDVAYYWRTLVEAKVWNAKARSGEVAWLQDDIEAAAGVVFVLTEWFGHPLREVT